MSSHRLLAALFLLLTGLPEIVFAADDVFDPKSICPPPPLVQARTGTLQAEGGDEAEWVICIPNPIFGLWNGDLAGYAHGTVDVLENPGKIESIVSQLDFDEVSIPAVFNGLGYAFAVVSRSKNGLSVKEGIAEVEELLDVFEAEFGAPAFTYLVGVSQGGAVTALTVEANTNDRFDGGLAACGPVGNFRKELTYLFDFLVLFEYFFRDELLAEDIVLLEKDANGNPRVPEPVLDNWEDGAQHKQLILDIIGQPAQVDTLAQLFRVAWLPTDPSGERTMMETSEELLDESVLGNNDAIAMLKGNPYDNRRRFYFGSENDFLLNFGVLRFRAEQAALDELKSFYETSGKLEVPLVTLHTIQDPRVPYVQEVLYRLKTLRKGSRLLHRNIPVFRFGHCAFEPAEALAAFALLVLKVQGVELLDAERVLPSAESRTRFRELTRRLHLR